jgi:hypothetical protein
MLSFLDQCQLPWILPDLTVYISNTAGVLEEAGTAYPLRAPELTPGFLVLLKKKKNCVVLLCVFTYWIPYCDVHYDFRIKTIFGTSLPLVVKSYLRYLCCVFLLFFFVLYLVYPMLPVSLGCPFLIAPSVLSNVYIKHIDLVRLS